MKITKRLLILIILSAAFVCLDGCGTHVKADISAYGDTPIEISGLKEDDFIITANDLAKLECEAATTAGRSEKVGTIAAVGPLLSTFLADYGKTVGDFTTIRFIASDGYRTVLKGDYLTDYDLILSVAEGNNPLPSEQRPLRLVIPNAESNMWIYSVIRIEFFE